jgi:hypothetical protein
MSIVVESGEYELEITEEGEVLFKNYDIKYDQGEVEFGYPKSKALLYLDSWNRNAPSIFLDLIYDFLSREEAVLIGRAWLGMITDEIEIEDKFGTQSVSEVLWDIDGAVAGKAEDRIEEISNMIGHVSAAYQQQTWMDTPRHIPYKVSKAQKGLDVSFAIADYLMIVEIADKPQSWESMQNIGWGRLGTGKAAAIRHLQNMAEVPIHEISLARIGNEHDQTLDEALFVKLSYETKAKVRKDFVGLAVRILVENEDS